MICVRRPATREEHRHDRGVGGSDLVCAFPQHFAVEAILAHYSSVAEGCRRARRTRTIFFSSFVPNSIRLPFKGSVEFGRSLSRVEVGNGLVEGVLVKWAVSLLLVLLLFFRRIYRRGGVLILGERRIDGGWHIAIARQLSICLCTFKELKSESKHKIARAHELLFQVHHGLRCPLPRAELAQYAARINDLLAAMVELCQPYNNSACKSIKYHWPRHWWETRLQLGCAAAEKSLERKLGQSQKRNFRFTNKHEATCEVRTRRFDAH